MDEQTVNEYFNIAVRGLRARAKRYPNNADIQNSIADAIKQLEAARSNQFDSEEKLQFFIKSIWSKVYGSLAKVKITDNDASNDFSEKEHQHNSTPDKSCNSCDHYCFTVIPFVGCPFKCNEPPYCAGFKLATKGEIYY